MDNKKNLLWISLTAPYDKVPHAGGQIENYYLKGLKSLDHFEILLLSFIQEEKVDLLDLDSYDIKNKIFIYKRNFIVRLFWRILNLIYALNVWGKYAGYTNAFTSINTLRHLKKLKSLGYYPDVIVLQWTQLILLTQKIRKLYPNVKIVSVEEDISFLSIQRKCDLKKGIQRIYFKLQNKALYNREINSLNNSDLVILNNEKDKLLIDKTVTTPIWVWCPFYHSMLKIKRKQPNKDILFFGAMYREENWKSVLWFIENVFYKLSEDIRFHVVGTNPPKQLRCLESDRIIISGYVENINEIFSQSICLVAPLINGAGIKIKIIEGLSSGIPVLTNEIGIEGIPAIDKVEYFKCITPNDYIKTINKLVSQEIDTNKLCENAKQFISIKFDYQQHLIEFNKKLIEQIN